jgi:hypothetical protein
MPTSCSWLNAVEGFFAKLTNRRLKSGVFVSVVDLPTAEPDKIIAAVDRGHQTFPLVPQIPWDY